MAITSAPQESPGGRPETGAAAARTAELYAQYARTVSGLCRALLRNHAEAEDAAQQTFLSAHRALLNGTEPREPAAWLATIARNECWLRIRSRMREPLPSDDVDAVTTHDPLAEALRRADLAALWQAIEALPKQQRDALLLREFGGLSYEELAAALAVSTPAVESLLFRARSRLRTQLRAAYASVTGASWIEALARVFVGGGAPVAAKVAALGVGAAAVTGSAVVGPKLLEQSHAPHTKPPATVRHVTRPVHRSSTTPPPIVAPVALVPAAATTTSRVDRRGPSRGGPPAAQRRGHDDAVTTTERRSGDDRRGETTTTTTETRTRGETTGEDRSGSSGERGGGTATTPTATTTATTSSGRGGGGDSGSDGGGSGRDGSAGSGGSGSGDGGSGGGSGDNGGGTPTVSVPTVTDPTTSLTVPTTEDH